MNQAKRRGKSVPAVVPLAREVMLDLRTVPLGVMPMVIEMSWERCFGYGLDRDHHSHFDVLERCLLADQMEKIVTC